MSDRPALDLIEELRLRRWARTHYQPPAFRESVLHPVVQNEFEAMDAERAELVIEDSRAQAIVPLQDTRILRIDAAHPVGKPPRSKSGILREMARVEEEVGIGHDF